ncbi:MAG: hypothetical protein HY996_09760 [Micrococcales bacterium]|nr:hypothetical protein [Micrococcales bacterium]
MTALALAAAVLRVLLGVAFFGMGVLHFVPGVARGMRAMIPPFFRRPPWPSPRVLVVVTGLCEIAGAIGLQIPYLRYGVGILLVLFLAAVFPANAFAARDRRRFGPLAVPFWPRLGAQVLVAALVLLAAFA